MIIIVKQNNYQMNKQRQASKHTSRYDFPSLSPLHERADYSRKILKINDAIKSIISISHMERMDIIAINNRSLCNHSKIRRAERTNRKINNANMLNLPNLKHLRLDLRKNNLSTKDFTNENLTTEKKVRVSTQEANSDAQLCQKLIEQYIEKLKDQKRFDVLANKTKLIEEACREIMFKLQTSKSKDQVEKSDRGNGSNNKRNRLEKTEKAASDQVEIKQLKLPINRRKARSITQTQYFQQINRIRRSSEYETKTRALNQRMFLRKMKQIKLHSQPE